MAVADIRRLEKQLAVDWSDLVVEGKAPIIEIDPWLLPD